MIEQLDLPRRVAAPFQRGGPVTGLVWRLGLGAFGLAWSITTVAAYLPPVLRQFTSSSTLIGLVLAGEGVVALLLPPLVGTASDRTRSPLGRRRPFMLASLAPMGAALAAVAFLPGLWSMAVVLTAFFVAYYVYEPPYRGLYPDLLPDRVFGRAQGVQHVYRGAAIGGALVAGGYLLSLWQPLPFVVAAGVSTAACAAVIWLVREDPAGGEGRLGWREAVVVPLRIVRDEVNVRRFLIANTAWETTFAGMRTFVVLYVIRGLDQPKGTASLVLGTVAFGYVIAAATSARFGDRFGTGAVILGASVVYGLGLVGATFARHWHVWYYAVIALVAVAGGTVMTLAWALLFKVMPGRHRGAITGLATMTKGIGLIIGPLGVGAVIDNAKPLFRSTSGYAAMWPAVAVPILAALPFVVVLMRVERARNG